MEAKLTGHQSGGLYTGMETDPSILTGRADFFTHSPEIVEDRTPYFIRYPLMSKDTVLRFIASRGCPYNWSFCYNEQIKDILRMSTVNTFATKILRT